MGWQAVRGLARRMETSRRTSDAVPHALYFVWSHQSAVGLVERRTISLSYAFCAMYLLTFMSPRSGVCADRFSNAPCEQLQIVRFRALGMMPEAAPLLPRRERHFCHLQAIKTPGTH